MTAPNVVSSRPTSEADRLERLANKPLAPHRHELRMLAERLRALEAFTREQDQQLTIEDVA
jgi:hypothetical protein